MRSRREADRHGPSLAIFGGPLDTGNLGVSALGISMTTALHDRLPDANVTIFDNGRGKREVVLESPTGRRHVACRGAWLSRRVYRTESLIAMWISAALVPGINDNVRFIDRAAAVLDISGGDSFTDLYGARRFGYVALPKEIALKRRTPLVLLPQTYGPFRSASARRRAEAIVAGASLAYARDEDSFAALQELAGDTFDPARHRRGVDVAFGLRPVGVNTPLGHLGEWLEDSHEVVGLNVSGLLYRNQRDAAERFDLRANYPLVVQRLAERILASTDVRLVLVPHVRGEAPESDDPATLDLLERLSPSNRVAMLPPGLGAADTKHIIGQLSWFAGARMHSTIAALSSGVPAVGLAYSDKFAGVFGSCDLRDRVLDLRSLSADEVLEGAWSAFASRDGDRDRLACALPQVFDCLDDQLSTIADMVARVKT